MNILSLIIFIVGIIITLFLILLFYITEINASVFTQLGFVDSKENLYDITFQKFDFDYSIVSGIDNNENEENLISDAIQKTDTDNTHTIKNVDYFA